MSEFDDAIYNGEQGIVFALFYIFTRADWRAALAHEYRSGVDGFTVADFGAEILRIGISAQTGGTTRFFV